jgi:hypothetical protein
MSITRAAVLLLLASPAWAGVVLNEVLYHAPDDLDALQFIELHNPDADTVADLSGWRLGKAIRYTFPAGTTIPAGGYLVVCKDPALFKKHYGFDAAGRFEGALAHDAGQIELTDAKGKVVDSVRYRSRGAWPVAADGLSATLERICPTAPGDDAANWAPSPMATPKVGGTPGKKNVNHAATRPPAVSGVKFPRAVGPDQGIKVEATVRPAATVELLYRVAGPGYEKEETTLRMTEAKGRFSATIPAQKAGQIVRFRIRAVDEKKAERLWPNPNEVRPAFSTYVHDKFTPGKIPFALVIHVGKREHEAARLGADFGRRFGAGPSVTTPARGASAYVHVDAKTGKPELFDFIQITPRTGGRKIHFHKDHPFNGMRTIHLTFEWPERSILAEPLAYRFHWQAGNAAPRTDHARTWIDGRPIGLQLMVEQPNKTYLKYNHLSTDGHLYKAQWTGWTLAARHEKKTRVHEGHADLIDLVTRLNAVTGDKQWDVIRKEFDVEQVVNHYAARMILSDWDGFFNNYFLYHDVGGTGKWTLHPWDQDKTWGFHDGVRGFEVFTEMPITFGMQGDRPPGRDVGFGFGGPAWWRTGGDLSRPLLANPTFRKLFLARTKQLLETAYTEKVMFPRIQALGERLEEEWRVRAGIHGEDPKAAARRLEAHLDSLRQHVKKRRDFLLAQDEIKKAGPFDRKDTK